MWALKKSLLLKDDKEYQAELERRKEEEERRQIEMEALKTEAEKKRKEQEERDRIAAERKAKEIAEWLEMRENIDQSEEKAFDPDGIRWVKCKKCGCVKPASDFSTYGGSGKNINKGLCNSCGRKKQ